MRTQRRFIIAGIVVTIFALIVFTLAVSKFGWDWTGFTGGESKITITSTSKGITTAKELQPAKALWDWLGLLAALAIPVVVGFGAAWFTRSQQLRDQAHEKLQHDRDQEAARIQHDRDQQLADQQAERERKAAEQQAEREHELTRDNQREEALQAYIDKMSELLLKEHLGELEPGPVEGTPLEQKREVKPEDEVRKIARIRTLTVLHRLDAKRKGSVLQFLQESGLITRYKCIIRLMEADLSGASLNKANLSKADLMEVDLSGADLNGTHLSGADLSYVNLSGAHLRSAYLSAPLEAVDAKTAYLMNVRPARVDPSSYKINNSERADLSGADLSGADLSGAHLRGAYLCEANLSGANLSGADLREAYLCSADLRGANLNGVDLSGAILGIANNAIALMEAMMGGQQSHKMGRQPFKRSNLGGANVTVEQLNTARSLKGATMTDGRIYS